MKFGKRLILLGAFLHLVVLSEKKWTKIYRKSLIGTERHGKKQLLFNKESIEPFSQLIFSWNAIRPKKGHFTFYMQVRDKDTKKWGVWHRMMEWGKDIQRSYASRGKCFSSFNHVRLEMKNPKKGDGFKIKIVSVNDASFSDLKGFAVSASNFDKYIPEKIDRARLSLLETVSITDVPKLSQFLLDHPENHRICSPTSCSMVAHYLTGQHIDPVIFAENAYDQGLNAYGSWPFNTAHAFEKTDGSIWFFPARLNSFTELHRQLKNKIPVVVSVRGVLTGAPKPYDNGHLLVVVGWDGARQEVICHDPAFKTHEDTLTRYPLRSFIRAWERSRRLVYWAEPIKKC